MALTANHYAGAAGAALVLFLAMGFSFVTAAVLALLSLGGVAYVAAPAAPQPKPADSSAAPPPLPPRAVPAPAAAPKQPLPAAPTTTPPKPLAKSPTPGVSPAPPAPHPAAPVVQKPAPAAQAERPKSLGPVAAAAVGAALQQAMGPTARARSPGPATAAVPDAARQMASIAAAAAGAAGALKPTTPAPVPAAAQAAASEQKRPERPTSRHVKPKDMTEAEGELPAMLKTGTLRVAGPKRHPDRPMQQKRARVLAEILTTEQTYIDKLGVIIDVFLEPMRRSGVAAPADLRTIFGDVEVIRSYNTLLLDGLRRAEAREDEQIKARDVAEVFNNQLAVYLKTYSAYINNYETSLQRAAALKQTPEFLKFVRAAEADPRCSALNLESLLIMPVQRIPRYILLLREAIKNTEAGDPALALFQSSVDKISALASLINQRKSDAESTAMVYVIQNQVTGLSAPLIDVTSRRFVKEGTIVQLDSQGRDQRELHVYLFNDSVLFAKSHADAKGKRKVVEQISLNKARSETFALPSGLAAWLLIGSPEDPQRGLYALSAPSHDGAETAAWADAAAVCISKLAERRASFIKAKASGDGSVAPPPLNSAQDKDLPYGW